MPVLTSGLTIEPLNRISRKAVQWGISPAWVGYRWVEKETVPGFLHRKGILHNKEYHETVHKPAEVQNPLPRNVKDRNELPDDRGWWGYSFRDVPSRISRETYFATLPDCLVVPCIYQKDNQFWVAILNNELRSVELDQISFRPWHADVLRSAGAAEKIEKATWFLERVYRNHSHWLTAHLPKLVLLKKTGRLGDVIMPPKNLRTPVINSSLEMLGIDPDEYRTFEESRPLRIKELTVAGTDRFRPELLQSVRDAICGSGAARPHRRIYISRDRAQRRKLLNEKEIWPILEKMGFEKIFMEDMSFPEQVTMMQQTAVLVAPHGAAITNVIFCQPGTHVIEIADLSFPNPNFYALSSAMGHYYWILKATGVGDGHPLKKDLWIEPSVVENTVREVTDR